MIDSTITVGNIIEIAVIGGGGVTALLTLRMTVGTMKTDLSEVKSELKKFGDLLVGEVLLKMAVSDQRIANLDQDVREMKHGRGFVEREINGEWPR